jgi:PilZ domain
MIDERRKHPRTEINQLGYISAGGAVMRCLVLNISSEGAAVEVDNPAFVPQRFRLVMANDASAVHECRIAWIQENRVGLTFVEPQAPGT